MYLSMKYRIKKYKKGYVVELIKKLTSKDETELNLHIVSKCDCSLLVACKICGDEKGLDGDFWKNKDVC